MTLVSFSRRIEKSMPELMNELNTFSNLSQLKPNTTKSDRMLTNIYCSI